MGHGKQLIDGLKKMFKGFIDFFKGIFTGDLDLTIKGIGEIFDGLGDVVSSIIESIKEWWYKFLDWIDEKTGGKFHGLIENIKKYVGGFYDNLINTVRKLIDAVKQIFSGLIEFISGVFTGDFDKALEGVKKVWKGWINFGSTLLEGFINGITNGINFLIRALNKIHFDVPDWIPGIGGKSFGIDIPEIPPLKIPRLAQGAVIPPNREFLAVLGDQKHGTNIEAPLDTIIQAIKAAFPDPGGGTTDVHFTIELDGDVLYKGVKRAEAKRGNIYSNPALAR